MMKVEEIMTRNVIYAEVPGNREQVLETIQEKKISGIPLVKKGTKNLIGIITRERHASEPRRIAACPNDEQKRRDDLPRITF
jgi:predicted transcriptional regulator